MTEPQPAQNVNKRIMPQSELDFNMLTTNPVWGREEVPAALKKALNRESTNLQTGEITTSSMWSNMGFFTRDFRLGNLSTGGRLGTEDNEIKYCQYFTDLAYDLIDEGFTEPFLICLSRPATLIELSHSKGGFFRKILNTIRQETTHQELEPPKKSLFGISGRKDQ